jgi:ribosomal protein S18 acetylase RimI-like enzyme
VDNIPVGFGIYARGKINFLGIEQQHHGQGYATMLLRYMINQMANQSHNNIRLNVVKNNQAAINLYQNHHFKCSDDPKDNRLLSCELDIPKEILAF